MKTPTIETERLLLRPLVFEDCYEAFERWTSDPEVAKFMRYNAHKSVEETKEWLSTVDEESDTAYDFAICVKAEGNYLCGSCGVYLSPRSNVWNVGYNLAKDHWRQGYGTEVMTALVNFLKNDLKVTAIEGMFANENVVSGHVMKKCGFETVGQIEDYKFDGITKHDCELLRINVKGEKKKFKLSNGIEIEPIGYGTYLANEGSIIKAANAGYRYFDTASFYKNEEMVGKELKESGLKREDVFIASKIWPTEFGYKEAFEAFERSINKLQTDYLDLYLLHWPREKGDSQWKSHLCQTWKAVSELYKAGKIKAIGVSNFLPHHMKVLEENFEILPMVNQLELHIGYMQNYAVDYCRERNIHIQAWSPLGRGRIKENPFIVKMAEKYMVTPEKLMLRFLNQQDISIIPKSNNEERMKANLDIYDFTIDEFDMSLLLSLPQLGFSEEHPDL